jgi:hypothetical protein
MARCKELERMHLVHNKHEDLRSLKKKREEIINVKTIK